MHPGPTFRGGLNVWTADVGGVDGGGGVCEAGRAGGRGKGGVGVGCVGMWVVCVGGRRMKESGREGEGGEEATNSVEPWNSHKQSLFFLAWLVTFTEIEKVLTRCLSYRHCRDCFNVLQNHTFRQYFLPMCLLVVAVSLGINTRLKHCYLAVLMNTIGTALSILCISIVHWAPAHFGITCFCLYD